MDAITLYKFVHDNNMEYHECNGEMWLFVTIPFIKEWNKMVVSMLDEDGLECVMKEGYFCFAMDNICEYHDIELEKVFDKPWG